MREFLNDGWCCFDALVIAMALISPLVGDSPIPVTSLIMPGYDTNYTGSLDCVFILVLAGSVGNTLQRILSQLKAMDLCVAYHTSRPLRL
jgi:hypothetical protein